MEADLNRSETASLNEQSQRPIFLDLRSSKVFILIVVSIAVFTDTFFYTLIIPILPKTLEQRAGILPDQVQKWISVMLSTYALTNLITSPIAGVIVDRSGNRRTPLLVSLVVMAASTTMYAFGRRVEILIIARALQGASAAVIRVGGLALITDTFGAGSSGAAMGWQSIGMFVGTFTGPSISGILYDALGHSAVFVAAYSVLAIDFLLRLIVIERKTAAKWFVHQEDSTSNETSLPRSRSQESLLEAGLAQRSYTEDTSPNELDASVTQSSQIRFTILLLLLNRRLLTALWATFACAIIMTALETVVPLYTTSLFSWTPTQNGLLLIALAVSVLIDPLLGSWTNKYGSRRFSVVGFAAITFIYFLATTVTNNRTATKTVLCVLFVCLGFAIGAVMTPNMVEISLLVHAEEKSNPTTFRSEEVMGQAYGTLSVAYGLGSLVGPAWGGALIITHGWVALCVSFAVLAGASTIIMLVFAGSSSNGSE